MSTREKRESGLGGEDAGVAGPAAPTTGMTLIADAVYSEDGRNALADVGTHTHSQSGKSGKLDRWIKRSRVVSSGSSLGRCISWRLSPGATEVSRKMPSRLQFGTFAIAAMEGCSL